MIQIRPINCMGQKIVGDLLRIAPSIEPLMEQFTSTVSNINREIQLLISDDIIYINPRINLRAVIDDLYDVLDELDEAGLMLPGYGKVREIAECERDSFRPHSENKGYWSDEDIIGTFGKAIDIISGKDMDMNWPDIAKREGYPEIAAKLRKICGQFKARVTKVSVTYSDRFNTITLYRRVLGDPYTKDIEDEWVHAFCLGLFYAFHYFANPNRANKTLIESFDSCFSLHLWESYFGMPYKAERLLREWEAYDMHWWPYSGALYLTNIGIAYHDKEYLFRRTFKRSLTDEKAAFDDLKAAYRLYEGYDYSKLSGSKLGKKETYTFDGVNYTAKNKLALAIIKKYMSLNPMTTSAQLMAEFDSSLQGIHPAVIRRHDAEALLISGKDRTYSYSLAPEDIIPTADDDCVVYRIWDSNNIKNMIAKGNSLGYGPIIIQ